MSVSNICNTEVHYVKIPDTFVSFETQVLTCLQLLPLVHVGLPVPIVAISAGILHKDYGTTS